MTIRIYVGGLPETVTREEVLEVFATAPEASTLKLITDRKTGKCRGFGFLTITTDEVADSFITEFNGHAFKEGSLRIERAEPKPAKEEGARETRPVEATDTEREAPRKPTPRPVKAAAAPVTSGTTSSTPAPMVRTERAERAERPVLHLKKDMVATAEAAPETTESGEIKPFVRPQPRSSVAARPAEAAARRDTNRGRRTGSGTAATTATNRQEGRRPSTTGGNISYRDLEEAGAIDPRWAGLLEAKKLLGMKV